MLAAVIVITYQRPDQFNLISWEHIPELTGRCHSQMVQKIFRSFPEDCAFEIAPMSRWLGTCHFDNCHHGFKVYSDNVTLHPQLMHNLVCTVPCICVCTQLWCGQRSRWMHIIGRCIMYLQTSIPQNNYHCSHNYIKMLVRLEQILGNCLKQDAV